MFMLGLDDASELVIWRLKALGDEMGGFVAGILSNDITRDEQIAFAHELVDLAEVIRKRAVGQTGVVIEGSATRATPGDPPRPRTHRG
jgi:hypothetical protein